MSTVSGRDSSDDRQASSSPGRSLGELVAEARRHDMGRVHILAWRDLDDPEAGGSELHAHRIASLWAAAGLEVTMRTSRAEGQSAVRAARRLQGGPQVGPVRRVPEERVSEVLGRHGRARRPGRDLERHAVLLAAVGAGPRVVFLHHVHAEMWQMTLPPRLARSAAFVESRSRSSVLPAHADRHAVGVVARRDRLDAEDASRSGSPSCRPASTQRFTPGGERSTSPLVVAVGRLVPVKRFDALIDVLVEAQGGPSRPPAVIVGEGYERDAPRSPGIASSVPDDWLEMPGRISDAELVDVYRRAWLLVELVAARGLGDDGHRGRGVRDSGSRHPDSRPPGCRGRRCERDARGRPSRHRARGLRADRRSDATGRAQRRAPSNTPRGSRGRRLRAGLLRFSSTRRGQRRNPRTRSASASAASRSTASDVMIPAGSNCPGHEAPTG